MINLVIMARCLKSIGTEHHAVKNDFLMGVVAAPGRNALEKNRIDTLEKLSDYSENEIMQLHGFGKNTMQKLKTYMKEKQISFKTN